MTLSGDDDDNITKFLKENGDSTIVKQPCQPSLAFMVRHEIDRLCDSQKIVWALKRKPGSQKPTTFGLCALLGTLHNETHQSPTPKICMSLLSAFLWILLCLINKSDSDINFCLFFYHIMNSVFLLNFNVNFYMIWALYRNFLKIWWYKDTFFVVVESSDIQQILLRKSWQMLILIRYQ